MASIITTTTNWFTAEIQQMMFGFGDCRRPQPETAVLVEEIVHQQMIAMMYQAWEVVSARGDKHISIEDILFLLRKDTTKLRRLLRYYEVRDLKHIIKSNMADDGKKLDCTNVFQLGEKSLTERRALGKNLQVCYDFLASIDQTGELLSLFDDKEMDVVKHERMVRAELKAQGLDSQAYVEFCKARQANFSQRYTKSQRFRDWLVVNISPDIAFTASALEMFSYLAYETVAQIVDLALLVKQDGRARPGDPLSRTRPALCVSYSQLQTGTTPSSSLAAKPADPINTATTSGLSGGPSAMAQSWDSTILPSDVHEAMRRFYADISPLASSMKFNSNNSPWHKTLCC